MARCPPRLTSDGRSSAVRSVPMPAIAAPLRTRPLVLDDASVVADLALRLGASESAAQWHDFLQRPRAIAVGAFAEAAIVGYAAGEVRIGFGMPAPVGWVEAFGVDLAWRARGVGWTLAEELLRRFGDGGATHVYTVVPVHDRVLAPFFRQLGFRDELLACLGRSL